MGTSHAWDRQPNEPLIWYRRFTALRLMSPVRSISAVYQQESREHEQERSNAPGRWYALASKWKWEERCAAFDEYQARELEQEIAAEKKRILSTRYALMHKRVEKLDEIAQRLIDYLADERNVWLPDVKAIGNGPSAQRVDLVRFNDALFLVIDKYLGSIASELGERVRVTKQEITGKDGKPLIPGHDELLGALSDKEFEQLKQLQAQALARLEQHHGDRNVEH